MGVLLAKFSGKKTLKNPFDELVRNEECVIWWLGEPAKSIYTNHLKKGKVIDNLSELKTLLRKNCYYRSPPRDILAIRSERYYPRNRIILYNDMSKNSYSIISIPRKTISKLENGFVPHIRQLDKVVGNPRTACYLFLGSIEEILNEFLQHNYRITK